MSTTELEMKIRELRQLQQLIEEAQARPRASGMLSRPTWASGRSCGPGSIK